MNNDVVKRLLWMGLVTGVEALASIAAIRAAQMVWRRVYGEDPPA